MTAGALSRFLAVAVACLLPPIDVSLVAASHESEVDKAIAAGDYAKAVTLMKIALSVDSGDRELRFTLAQVFGYLGDYEAAHREYAILYEQDSENVDYVFGLAQSLAGLQRDADALVQLEDAVRLAPDYEAVWRLRFSIQLRQTSANSDRELERLRRASALRFPQANWWQAVPADKPRAWTVVAGVGIDDLSRNLPSWDHQFLEIRYKRDVSATYLLRAERAGRFDASDAQYVFGGEWQWAENWFAGLDVGLTSDAVFLPHNAYSVHLGKSLGHGWVTDVRYRRREYDSVSVATVTGTAEKYFGDFRAAYALGVSHLRGAGRSLSHTATLNWYVTPKSSYGVSLTSGEEAEVIGPSRILETDVRGLTFSGRHRISERFGFDWWLGVHEQGDFYRRRYGGVAISFGI